MPVLLLCQVRFRPHRHLELEQQAGAGGGLSCDHRAWLDRFTVSDFEPGKLLAAKLVD